MVRTITFNESRQLDLNRCKAQSLGVVERLTTLGVKPGQCIAIQSRCALGTALIYYAAQKLRLAVFPLDPDMSVARCERLLDKAGAGILLIVHPMTSAKGWSPDSIEQVEIGRVQENRVYDGGELIIATSGSSGEAKAVLLSQQALQASAAVANRCVGLDADGIWLACLPLFHIGGLSILTRAWRAKAAVLLHERFSAEQVWDDLRRHRVTHISLVPVMLQRLLDVADGKPPPRSLRVVLVGGAALSKHLAQKAFEAGWPVWVTYGMSETASQVATRPVQASDFTRAASAFSVPLLESVSCELIKERGAGAADSGRIKLKADFLMSGYLSQKGEQGAGLDADGWFVTSDIGYFDGKSLTVLGRADDVLLIGGKNIHPMEVEEMLATCPRIGSVYVFGVEDEVWGNRLCVVFDGEIVGSEFEQWCRQNIAQAYRPRIFQKLEQLPRLNSGKVDKVLIREMLVSQ